MYWLPQLQWCVEIIVNKLSFCHKAGSNKKTHPWCWLAQQNIKWRRWQQTKKKKNANWRKDKRDSLDLERMSRTDEYYMSIVRIHKSLQIWTPIMTNHYLLHFQSGANSLQYVQTWRILELKISHDSRLQVEETKTILRMRGRHHYMKLGRCQIDVRCTKDWNQRSLNWTWNLEGMV